MKYNSFEDMTVWKNSMELSIKIFRLTEKLPKKEDYGLTSQIRRSALSIAGNLSEGFGRKHTKDKMNFYYDSRGSLCETKNHLLYGKAVGYFTGEEIAPCLILLDTVWKELNALIFSLKSCHL